jgi:7-carboxy-7-deazaguanine synthase (Cx14CxxC type)
MPYTAKEIFASLCGEGFNAGRAAVFCRFSGCNLWSGREEDRASAICPFCDTDFVGGTKYADADSLTDAVDAVAGPVRFVVLTGGEPTLQADAELIAALKRRGYRVAIETNGTNRVPLGLDWIAVSPKAGAELIQRHGHELKIVFPQAGLDPADYLGLTFRRRYLQPMDGPDLESNTRAAIAYILDHPQWRLSEQRHKRLGLQ